MAAEKLTRETVVERALDLADREGLDAVTIRRLAGELGVTPMALYWHVKNKDELLLAMADHAIDLVAARSRPGEPWDVRLRAMVEALVDAMRRYPCLPVLLGHVDKTRAESFRRATDTALDVLAEAGFTLAEGYLIASHLLVGVAELVKNIPAVPAGMTDAEAAECARQARLRLEMLPADRYPNLVAYAPALTAPPDPDAYLAFGLDLLLSGVEAQAARLADPAQPRYGTTP
ncbi:TetR family transcriptional regulator [Bailinhaonella thermotolerans]|uniref:TetR family transcriptional regulator n=1 Tax=Bailinhaonella thermotolerans TaxID=1070861 RepID=UPI002413AC0F|nr:TetR family transcriptional regulator [Bailinhaonella thermotolerans]